MNAQFLTATETRRKILQVLRDLERAGERFVITREGKPAAVLMGYDEYESLLATAEVMADEDLKKKIRRGLRDEKAGRLRAWDDVFDGLD